MFTGIVGAVGRIASITPDGDVTRLVVETPAGGGLPQIGASVCFSGICLTVTETDETSGTRALVRRPRARNAAPHDRGHIGKLAPASISNARSGLATSLAAIGSAAMSTGWRRSSAARTWARRSLSASTHRRSWRASSRRRALSRSTAPRSPSTLSPAPRFDCHLIPHTLAVTTWGERKAGDAVNLEVDLVARYVARLLSQD